LAGNEAANVAAKAEALHGMLASNRALSIDVGTCLHDAVLYLQQDK
jgi:hypothetical protein